MSKRPQVAKRPQEMTFAEQIELVRTSDIGVPRRMDIDLSIAETGRE